MQLVVALRAFLRLERVRPENVRSNKAEERNYLTVSTIRSGTWVCANILPNFVKGIAFQFHECTHSDMRTTLFIAHVYKTHWIMGKKRPYAVTHSPLFHFVYSRSSRRSVPYKGLQWYVNCKGAYLTSPIMLLPLLLAKVSRLERMQKWIAHGSSHKREINTLLHLLPSWIWKF